VDRDGKAAEVDAAKEDAYWWHDDVIDKGVDDFPKRSTDDDPDGKVDYATAHCERFEFLDK
jgi:hypothetical protein